MPSLAALELSQNNDMNKTLSEMPIMCYLSRPMCWILQLFLQTFLFANLCERLFVLATRNFKYSESAFKCYFRLIIVFKDLTQ